MFPLSDSVKASRFPFITIFFIILMIYVFVQEIIAPDAEQFINQFSLIPARIDFAYILSLFPFVTSLFLHGGILHIVSNLWFLWLFGDNVEDALPPLLFILLFLVAGVAGNVVQYLAMPTSDIPILGASGSVAGILGCYYVFFPQSKVKMLVFIVFFVTIVEISAPLMLGYWFVLQLFSGAGSLQTLESGQGGIAFFAHIAGFVVGLVVGRIYKIKDQISKMGIRV